MKNIINSVLTVIAAFFLTFSLTMPVKADNATTRDIMEFVDAQGTFCFPDGMAGCLLFVPPLENFLGSGDPVTGLLVSIDYAGIGNQYIEVTSSGSLSLGTEFSGQVTVRPHPDGIRAYVTVELVTHNALTWVTDGGDFNNALLFGQRAPDVVAGEDPALCNSKLQVKFINTAPGDPLPDLIQLFFAPESGQEALGLSIYCSALGELANGKRGRAIISQTGLFVTSGMGAVTDGFPVEQIKLQTLGKKD